MTLVKNKDRDLFAYFGGTFDPPHLGHEKMAKILAEEPLLSKIWIVPTSRNPLKPQFDSNSESAPMGSQGDRKKWSEIWIDSLNSQVSGEKKFELVTLELEKSEPTFTWDTLNELSHETKIPLNQIVLIVGSDQIPGFEKWKNLEKLFAAVHSIWIFQRKGYLFNPKNLPAKILELGRFRWMGPEIENFNSTEIRAHLRNLSTSAFEARKNRIENLPLPESLKSFFLT